MQKSIIRVDQQNSYILIYTFISIFFIMQPLTAYADSFPQGLKPHKLRVPNQQIPYYKSGVIHFNIFDKGCSTTDYGDGRGENDCINGNVRSVLSGHPVVTIGRSATYSFDIWISPSLSYDGWKNSLANGYLPGGHDSRLRLASWEGDRIHNMIYMLKADRVNGITFLGEKCQETKDFGNWVNFKMQVRWSLKKDGQIEVKCGEKVLYQKINTATAVNPHCYVTNQCEPGKVKNPREIFFLLGPVMAGFGPEWKKYQKNSQFTDIQDGGIEFRVRNFSYEIK